MRRRNYSKAPLGFIAFFIIAAILAVGSLVYTAKVYHDCDGQVVKNMFDIPVCVSNG